MKEGPPVQREEVSLLSLKRWDTELLLTIATLKVNTVKHPSVIIKATVDSLREHPATQFEQQIKVPTNRTFYRKLDRLVILGLLDKKPINIPDHRMTHSYEITEKGIGLLIKLFVMMNLGTEAIAALSLEDQSTNQIE
jgi:DNA-binding HxlR family transcriptional regulator